MKKILFTFFVFLYFFDANAQRMVYLYDKSGNRTKRYLGFKYYYHDFFSINNFDTSCRCIIATTPTPPETHALFWFYILSIDGQLALEFIELFNASTSSPKGTVTIRHLTDPLKFQTFNIYGTVGTSSGFEKFENVHLLEKGPTPFANGDVVYLSYMVN